MSPTENRGFFRTGFLAGAFLATALAAGFLAAGLAAALFFTAPDLDVAALAPDLVATLETGAFLATDLAEPRAAAAGFFAPPDRDAAALEADLAGVFLDAVGFAPAVLAAARPVPVLTAAAVDAALPDAFPAALAVTGLDDATLAPDLAEPLETGAFLETGLAEPRAAAAGFFAAPDRDAAGLEADLAGVFRDAVGFAPAVLAAARPAPVLTAAAVDAALPDAFPAALAVAGLDDATLAPDLAEALETGAFLETGLAEPRFAAAGFFAAPDRDAAGLEADLAGVFRDAVGFAPAVLAAARPAPVLTAAAVDAALPDAFPAALAVAGLDDATLAPDLAEALETGAFLETVWAEPRFAAAGFFVVAGFFAAADRDATRLTAAVDAAAPAEPPFAAPDPEAVLAGDFFTPPDLDDTTSAPDLAEALDAGAFLETVWAEPRAAAGFFVVADRDATRLTAAVDAAAPAEPPFAVAALFFAGPVLDAAPAGDFFTPPADAAAPDAFPAAPDFFDAALESATLAPDPAGVFRDAVRFAPAVLVVVRLVPVLATADVDAAALAAAVLAEPPTAAPDRDATCLTAAVDAASAEPPFAAPDLDAADLAPDSAFFAPPDLEVATSAPDLAEALEAGVFLAAGLAPPVDAPSPDIFATTVLFFTAALAEARFAAPVWDAAPTGDFFTPPAAAAPDAFPTAALFLAATLTAAVIAEPPAAAPDREAAPTEDSPTAPDFFTAALETATPASGLAEVLRDAVPFTPAVLAVARPVPVLVAADIDAAAPDAFPTAAPFPAAVLAAPPFAAPVLDAAPAEDFVAPPDLEVATSAPDLAEALEAGVFLETV